MEKVVKWPRGEYKGEWKEGRLEGKGVFIEAWGSVYRGEFKNNLAHGFGRQDYKFPVVLPAG